MGVPTRERGCMVCRYTRLSDRLCNRERERERERVKEDRVLCSFQGGGNEGAAAAATSKLHA